MLADAVAIIGTMVSLYTCADELELNVYTQICRIWCLVKSTARRTQFYFDLYNVILLFPFALVCVIHPPGYVLLGTRRLDFRLTTLHFSNYTLLELLVSGGSCIQVASV